MPVSVDLPMPGEPPSSTIEPGTRPPPSTRSSSPSPVRRRGTSAARTSASRTGFAGRTPVGPPRRPGPPKLGPPHGLRGPPAPRAPAAPGRHPPGFLDERVPLAAAGALPVPASALEPAGRAGEDGGRARHLMTTLGLGADELAPP